MRASVYASRWQRFITILAGIWVEMIFCAFATIVWWGTPRGSGAHDLAYKVMLITGVVVVVVNMNPLIKLDGYYAFSEILGFADIKEKSTAYLSGLVRKNIFRLPVEMDFVPRRRRAGFILYASRLRPLQLSPALHRRPVLLQRLRQLQPAVGVCSCSGSGAAHLPLPPENSGEVHSHRGPRQTRSRPLLVHALAHGCRARGAGPRLCFCRSGIRPSPLASCWRPIRFAVVRSTVPGRVTSVLIHEGEFVRAGDTLLRMTSAPVNSARAGSGEDAALTGLERVQAQLSYADLGSALQQTARARAQQAVVLDQAAQLTPRAPIDGVVAAPRLGDLIGAYLPAGATITQIDDLGRMRARIFVPDFAIGRVRPGAAGEPAR